MQNTWPASRGSAGAVSAFTASRSEDASPAICLNVSGSGQVRRPSTARSSAGYEL